MKRDRVKRWSDSVRYYRLVKKQREKEAKHVEAYNICVNGQCFYPKRKERDDVISVERLTIVSPRLLRILIARREQRKKQLQEQFEKEIKVQEEKMKNDNKKDMAMVIEKLKKELEELKQKEDKEHEKEVHRSR